MAPNSPSDQDQNTPRTPVHSSTVHSGRQATKVVNRSAVTPQPQVAPQGASPVATESAPTPAEPVAPSVNHASSDLQLPLAIVTKTQLSRALRELEKISDYFQQAAVRGSDNQTLPDISRELDGLMKTNNLNILQAQDRDLMKNFLSKLRNKAPVVHMSFPSEAGTDFLAKLLEWYRREAHPYTVMHLGLQPELAAGCTLRTTNKHFDFSFRKRFEKSKSKLISQLEAASQQIAAATQAEAQAVAVAASAQPAPVAVAITPAEPIQTAQVTPAQPAEGVTNV